MCRGVRDRINTLFFIEKSLLRTPWIQLPSLWNKSGLFPGEVVRSGGGLKQMEVLK